MSFFFGWFLKWGGLFLGLCGVTDQFLFRPIPRIDIDDGTYQLVLDDIFLHATICGCSSEFPLHRVPGTEG